MKKFTSMRVTGKRFVPAAVAAVVIGLAVPVAAFIGSLWHLTATDARDRQVEGTPVQAVAAVVKPADSSRAEDRTETPR